MFELSNPLWLLGLAVLPLVRWLHRFRLAGLPVRVSAVFLWEGQAAESAPGRKLAEPDPVWRLRALLVAVLLLAAARPLWPGRAGLPVEVWFDDSPSMYALENGVSRYKLALERLMEDLVETGRFTVLVRSLGDPGKTLTLDSTSAASGATRLHDWLATPGGTPILPAPALMDPSTPHWLVSDGAHPGLQPWLDSAPVSKVIQVGNATENVALESLSLRPTLAAPFSLKGLVVLANRGDAAANRRLQVSADDRIVYEQAVTSTPGETVQLGFRLEAGAGTVSARLLPTDALPRDDILQLGVQNGASAAVRIHGECSHHLRLALLAHPGLRITEETAPALTISCTGNAPTPLEEAVLHVPPLPDAKPVTAEPVWHPAAGPLRELAFAPTVLWSGRPGPVRNNATWLLSAGGQPLIVEDLVRKTISVYLDLDTPSLVREPVFPALIAGLVDRLPAHPLLDGVLNARNPLAEARIAPRPLRAPSAAETSMGDSGALDLAPYVIVMTCLLLLLDMAKVGAGPRSGG